MGVGGASHEALAKSIAASGLLALKIAANDSDELTARVGEERIVINASEAEKAASEVTALLERAGICQSPGQIDWVI